MDFGIVTFPTDTSIEPQDLGPALEERGFESLFYAEHTHIPTSRLTPAPNGEDELPEMYSRTFDPPVMLSAIAASTTRLRLGTSVSLPVQHDPIAMAKQAATLDVVSGGRFSLGVGTAGTVRRWPLVSETGAATWAQGADRRRRRTEDVRGVRN